MGWRWPSRKSAMVDIDAETVTTGIPVCWAIRSAVRCLVPVSTVGMEPSGTKCTPAARMRSKSLDRMIPPSIFASSRSAVGVNCTSRAKPPVETRSTFRLLPSTTSAPVRPCRIRSSPSRSGVPGASSAW